MCEMQLYHFPGEKTYLLLLDVESDSEGALLVQMVEDLLHMQRSLSIADPHSGCKMSGSGKGHLPLWGHVGED